MRKRRKGKNSRVGSRGFDWLMASALSLTRWEIPQTTRRTLMKSGKGNMIQGRQRSQKRWK
jgi:hypothetical protein